MSAPVVPADRSKEQTAFEFSKYAHVIDWTKTCVLIDGKPIAIVSAEFQYFRVPDRERWRPLLVDIKGMGFNTVRLYIHWGYHCPAEGIYNFRGNRDLDYLLQLCIDLELYVIVAPGPYICAEVQGGGFPIWLIANRDLRVRHMTFAPLGFVKKWDQKWHDYCAEYFALIVRKLVKYERTTNPTGCIIALQIENELREGTFIGLGGYHDEMRLLCKVARDNGSTVPFFHNDDSPVGSWSSGEQSRTIRKAGRTTGANSYRFDWYGFDLYLTFPTGDRSGDLSSCQVGMLEAFGVSACLNCCGVGGPGVGGSDTPCLSCLYDSGRKHAPPPSLGWSVANQMEAAVDNLERRLEMFGGSAREAPVVCAEAQVGWINQWGRMRTYDDIYSFFGDGFSVALQNSLVAQGVMVINHYIAYGGTNHGTVGDTEVYSSYDYSAFIREFGMVSGRGRQLRYALLFARSFSDVGLSNSLTPREWAKKKSRVSAAIKSTVPAALVGLRESICSQSGLPDMHPSESRPRTFAFLRNLQEVNLRFNLIANNVVVPCQLRKCESFIAPLYHKLDGNLSIFVCTVPVICRTIYAGSELWVLRVRKSEVGRIVFRVADRLNEGRQGVVIKWASFGQSGQSESTPSTVTSGELSATDQDPRAATSLLSSPLEELPLAEQNSLGNSSCPLGLVASTEDVGLCFSTSFASAADSLVASVFDISENGPTNPILRLLCLTDEDASTFAAELSGNDDYKARGSVSKPFMAAWGVSNLSFTPPSSLEVGFSPVDDKKALYTIIDQYNSPLAPEQFQAGPEAAGELIPGLFVHNVPEGVLATAVNQGMGDDDALATDFEIPLQNIEKRSVDWNDDVLWKRIPYENRDPLDHHMTSGHVTYRLRFRSPSKTGSLVINVRHSAVIWCNGVAVGDQICFSHNIMSAGAMHGIDLHHAGKKRHNLTKGLQRGPDASGFHEVIILVLSMGQSRSPFLLNDVRNKRGLLSGRLSRMRFSDVTWEIFGVDVTRSDDAYGTSGLPLEDDANTPSCDAGFMVSPRIEISANAGVTYYRGTFRVPAASVVGGSLRYPLRIQVLSGAFVRAMIWVNTLFMGRYVENLGPQNDFYVPEGLIKERKGNMLVLALYGSVDTNISVRILPWVVDSASGNLKSDGEVYAIRCARFELAGKK